MKRIISIMAIVLTLIGGVVMYYITTPISCDQLINREIRNLDFERLTPQSSSKWIDINFRLFQRMWKTGHANNQEAEWNWESFTSRFALTLSSRHQGVLQAWKYKAVRVSDMTRCLGVPDSYVGTFTEGPEAILFDLSLFYLKHGYVFTSSWFEPKDLTSTRLLNENTQLLSVWLLPPGKVDEMVKSFYRYHQSIREQELIFSAIKPWPNRIEEITIPGDFVDMTMR